MTRPEVVPMMITELAGHAGPSMMTWSTLRRSGCSCPVEGIHQLAGVDLHGHSFLGKPSVPPS
jgi:hypothetical protein